MKKLIYSFLKILFATLFLVSCGPDSGDYSFNNPYDNIYNSQPDTAFIAISSVSKTYKVDGVHKNPLTFTWNGSDNDGAVTEYLYRLDEGDWILSGQLFAVYSTINTGIHKFYVKAGDDKGAFDKTPEEVSFEVDASPPSVSFTTPRHNAADVDAVNASITATFSEPMNDTFVNISAFTLLDESGNPVAGNFDFTYNTMTFTPLSSLGNGASYDAIISSTVSDRVGNLMLSGYKWSFSVLPWDDTPPQVSSTTPSRNATNVTVDSSITAIFSEEMTAFTISTSTFKLEGQSGLIDGVVSHSGVTASFNPTESLVYSTTYTASITTGAKDLAGNSLSTDYQWTFTTGPVPDTTPPTVSFVDPINNDSDVSANSAISVSFSEPVDAMSVTTDTFKLFNNISGLPVAGAVTIAGTTATFIPMTSLNYTTLFTASLSTGIKDLAGNQLPSLYEWNFTTGEAPDLTPPAVTLTTPGRDTKGSAVNSSVSATFSEALDPSSVSTVTFELKNYFSGLFENGSVIYNGTTAVFTPFSSLEPSTWYVAILRADIKDVAGNSMPIDYSWRFQTSDGPDEIAPVVSKTAPFENATAVAINTSIVATFNEPVEPSTITTATFTLWDEYSNPVKGTVSYSGLSATFAPYSSLKLWHEYMALVSFFVTDTAGNPMEDHHFWRFSTGGVADILAPVATALSPLQDYTSVTKDTSLIVSFSEPMDGTSINTESFTLSGSGGLIAGNVYYDGSNTAVFELLSTLSPGMHTATLNSLAKDLAGNSLSPELSWSFDVVDLIDTVSPFVLIGSLSPLEGENSVDVNNLIYAKFNEPMDRTFINTSTFTLFDGTSNVEGSVYYDGVLTAMFIPAAPLTYSGFYTATLTTEIRDRAGNPLQSPGFAWQFATGELLLNVSHGIAGGGFHSLAVKSDKSLAAWGYNTNGELGDGTTYSRLLPVQILGLTGVIASAAGDNHSMALLTDKTVWVWGDNTLGQLGIGTEDTEIHSTAVKLTGLSDIVSLSAGSFHSMALKSDGTVWAWGDNTYGQLGDGTFVYKASPVQVRDQDDESGYLQGVKSIAAGEQHSVAVKSDGTVLAWGWNNAGQLGNMTTANSFFPVSVVDLSNVTEVAAGILHTLALKTNGTVWAWGWNESGQLGDKTYTESLVPVEVIGLSGVSDVSSGSMHSMALKSDGSVWTWGDNSSGQLGNAEVGDKSNAIVQASSLTAATAISGGSLHSIALKFDGTVWTWGDNSAGQLGDGTNFYSPIPVKVAW
ncbi:MAG: Ig-like domain-containing protein [bacterium]|nr:Ig-like domain-containing protein [bacterium]